MNNLFVKKGDAVLVIAGKDKGKTAKVNGVNSKSNRIIVEGVNVVSKNKKAKTAQEKSTIVKIEAPINASNVMVVCPSCKKATRVAHKEIDGQKVRVCKHCGASLDKEFVKQVKKSKKTEEKKSTKTEVKEVAPIEEVKKQKKTTAKTTKKVEEVGTKAKTVKKPAFRKV